MAFERPPIGPAPRANAISPGAVETRFMTRVYGWMALGLVVTALVSAVVIANPSIAAFVFGNKLVFYGLMFAELGLVFWMSGLVGKMSAATASGVFLFYSGLNGVTLSILFFAFTASSLASTFFVTAGTFGAMSVYGFVTKRSLTGVGSFCFMGLIGVVIAGIVNIFLQSSMLTFIVSCVGVIVFVGLTAYDTQKLKMMAAQVDADSEEGRRGAVQGALSLYLDFINLFIMLLNLFGKRR